MGRGVRNRRLAEFMVVSQRSWQSGQGRSSVVTDRAVAALGDSEAKMVWFRLRYFLSPFSFLSASII